MPIYEYICDDCSKKFEVRVSSHKAKSACPHCGSKSLTKQFSTFAAHGASTSPCEGGVCPSMAGEGGGGCGGGKCPYS